MRTSGETVTALLGNPDLHTKVTSATSWAHRAAVADHRARPLHLACRASAAEWLEIWTNLGRSPRTIDAYARGL